MEYQSLLLHREISFGQWMNAINKKHCIKDRCCLTLAGFCYNKSAMDNSCTKLSLLYCRIELSARKVALSKTPGQAKATFDLKVVLSTATMSVAATEMSTCHWDAGWLLDHSWSLRPTSFLRFARFYFCLRPSPPPVLNYIGEYFDNEATSYRMASDNHSASEVMSLS